VDESLAIEQSRQGSTAAFNQLVAAYQSQVYNTAYRIVGDPQAAADAAQEAFISAYKNIRAFRGGSFKAWLLRIVTNACYDQFRRKQRHPTTSLDALLVADEEPDTLPGAVESPEEHALRREMHVQVQDALMTLPPDQRTVVVLSDIQGLSYEEIAEVTQATLGTVKSRLSRAREHLRAELTARELSPSVQRHSGEAQTGSGRT
jgi:RNA polymerase sigma-70 factor (ECF subfamily)